MNNYEKYHTLKASIESYKTELVNYDGKIHTRKVIASLDRILKKVH